MSRFTATLLLLIALILLAGCGGVEQARARREVPGVSGDVGSIDTAGEQATAEDFDYHGWKAFRLTNGMVTLVVVPDMGGRIIEYKLGGHPFLWAEPGEPPGKAAPGEASIEWRDFGGYRAWPAPQAKWTPPPDSAAAAFDAGPWTGKITVPQGRSAEVELTSPKDQTSGLQAKRTIQLFGGSSRVHITEQFTNQTSKPTEWAIRQISQLVGVVEPGAVSGGKARVYLPLNPDSKLPDGYRLEGTGGAGQFKVLSDGILQIAYQGEEAAGFTDTQAGWVAAVDEAHGYAFVQRFGVSPLGTYPENGATVGVRVTVKPACLELSLFSPLRTLQPEQSLEVSTDWYAARVAGPIVSCSDVAAVREPLKLTRKDGKLRLTGVLGVYAPGSLALNLQDGSGTTIGQPTLVKVSPAEEVKLDQVIPEEPTARKLLVELQNSRGTPLGEVGTVDMGVTVARAEASGD
ncbi:MAG: DUF4380 domain-containing protein [Armatimonadetes bacterium]|nr:DUF4380 domain-containing protein [Armatimonadota bacterium]